ncbi:MAG: CehA/McbA family metallohydrolase [Phenylobacterium sp.]|uniref:CehA/McbA family metallohydrolase n=1 Tax=Phenylobacterium sp. TaxID=1871053 RepID=UPI0027270621|nr:CehA/McbA family metallohydrolase [Phenylobacterium sp.]MDO9432861.1 CehA/McbA family metallohydrolase [Phenylobacterium sp.]
MAWPLQQGLRARAASIALVALALFLEAAVAHAGPVRAPDVILTGTLTRAAHETYTEVPFKAPPGVDRITVEFAYTGREQRSVIDLGLRDPERFRGWSGGNKSSFTLAESDATPSYLAGPLKPGVWKLVLGAPNIRKDSRADYTAKIWFDRKGAAAVGFNDQPLASEERWWRGDLHMHTGHSDGSCLSRKGAKVPCPTYKTLEAATARGLDFVAVTDHNATSHFGALRELAPYFDDLLIIPGREITTFYGHANLFGPTAFVDFQLGGPHAPKMADILRQVEATGGMISINHPGLPSGEFCMGCGWTAPDTDYGRIQAIEAVNGGNVEGPLSSIGFWEQRLNEGRRITAVGGSDNHDATLHPDKAPAIGVPTTVVRAGQLSQAAILTAIGQGHVFLDIAGTRDRLLDVRAIADGATAQMGDALSAPVGTKIRVDVHVVGASGGSISLAGDGAKLASSPGAKLTGADQTVSFDLTADGARRWLRIDVRGADGKLILLGNPIYLTP